MDAIKKLQQSQWFGVGFLVVLTLICWAIFKVLRPETFGSPAQIMTYLQSALIYAVGGCGMYFIVTQGLWDFSIGSVLVLSCLLSIGFSQMFGVVGLVVAPIVCGIMLGFFNGLAYTVLRIPSLIVTVGLSLIYESFSVFASNWAGTRLDAQYNMFGSYPYNVILALIAFFLCGFILKYTKVGTYINAIGTNELTAKNMGVNVDKYKTPLMGAFFGLAFKKYGHPVVAIVIGELIISMMFAGFVALGMPTTINNVVTGATLLIVVTLTVKRVKGAVVK